MEESVKHKNENDELHYKDFYKNNQTQMCKGIRPFSRQTGHNNFFKAIDVKMATVQHFSNDCNFQVGRTRYSNKF